MSATIDGALTDRVSSILAEISSVEAARVPVDAEVQTELARLDALAVRAAASPSWWLSSSPAFSIAAVSDSIAGAMMLVSPSETKKVAAARVKRACESWRGLRLVPAERERRLSKLKADLRTVRARIELQRRAAEQVTGIMQPRIGPLDHPEVWLLPSDALNALAASNGRAQR